MLNNRQKLAEQLLIGEAKPEVPKTHEKNLEKKAPPKFKRPGVKSENESNTEKKSKANLDDLLENYEKHELREVDLNKISSTKHENEEKHKEQSATDSKNIEGDLHPAAAGKGSGLFGNEHKEIIQSDEKISENDIPNNNKINFDGIKNINKIADSNQNEKKKENYDFTEHLLPSASENLNKHDNEIINMVMNNEENQEHNTTGHMNLNPSENTFDEINLNNNFNNEPNNFKEIGSTTSIHPKNVIFQEDIGTSNNLFESTTSYAKNFLENLSAPNVQNNNHINNNNNFLNNSTNMINLGSEKPSNNSLIVANMNSNRQKDLVPSIPKHSDNIDFHINPNHENKSSNTNSENYPTSQGEDNLSIPEINCKSIELTNENFNEKKHSTNSSNLNLNNQSNGNYQETKEYNCDANNFFSNAIDNNNNNKFENANMHNYNNDNFIRIANFDDDNIKNNKNNSNKILKDFSKNLNETEIINSKKQEMNTANDYYSRNISEKFDNKMESRNNNGNSLSEINRIQILDNEIANLRKIINEYKNKEIQENEPMLKLEIVNLINTESEFY
jgi:hypothetical protein